MFDIVIYPYEASNEVLKRGMSRYTGRVIGQAHTLTNARKRAVAELAKTDECYVVIHDASTAKYVTFTPNKQRLKSALGDVVGEVYGNLGLHHPNRYYIWYPAETEKMKYRKYLLNKDGTLGRGMW